MAAPAFAAIGTQLQGSASTMNVPAPAGMGVDDILVVIAFIDTAGATVTAAPSGWTQAPNSPITGPDNHSMVVWYKRAVSGDTGLSTFDFTLSGSVYRNAACSRYTGAVTSGDPWDVTSGVGSNVSQTTTEDVAITTTVADTLKIWGATNWSGGTWTPPTSFTERRDTGDGVCTSADLAQAVAGGSGAIVGTCTGSDKRCAWVGALKPVALAAADSSYTMPRMVLPGLVGPDGKVYLPGLEFDYSAASATNALAGDAAGTGTAPQPTALVAPNAGGPAGTGTAPQPAALVAPNAGGPSGTGSALQPSLRVSPAPVAPTGTGSGLAPTAFVRANAGLAEAVGTAGQATVSTATATNAPAGLASGTGTAFAPTIQLSVNAGLASATGTAGQATVTTSSSVNAPAGLASATGSAGAPAILVAPRAGVGTATGTSPAATALKGAVAFAGLAGATGTAFAAKTAIGAQAGVAQALGTAFQPVTAAEVIALLRTLTLYSSRTFGADGYKVGENHTVWLPARLPVGAPLVVVCHGTAAEASWYPVSSVRYRPLEELANTGLVVVAGDLGEPSIPDGWGNDRSVAAVGEVIAWAASQFGCDTTRVCLIGDSAGGATALNWARQHPTQVAGVALRAGVADIEAIYQNGAGNALLVTLINQAYAVGGGWPAQRATHDPALNTSQLTPIADRIRCYYTSGDDLIPPQSTIDFAGDVGCELIPVGDMVHSDAVHTAIHDGDLADWLWSLT